MDFQEEQILGDSREVAVTRRGVLVGSGKWLEAR